MKKINQNIAITKGRATSGSRTTRNGSAPLSRLRARASVLPSPNRTLNALLATTVLTSVMAVVAMPGRALAEDGDPCVMVGSACSFNTQGAAGPAAPGAGAGQPGGAGGGANHNNFACSGLTSPINATRQGGTGRAAALGIRTTVRAATVASAAMAAPSTSL